MIVLFEFDHAIVKLQTRINSEAFRWQPFGSEQ